MSTVGGLFAEVISTIQTQIDDELRSSIAPCCHGLIKGVSELCKLFVTL